MPIRAENKDRYPKDWPRISWEVRERAGWCCEECGVRNGQLGGRDARGAWHAATPKGERLLGIEWPAPGEWWWCEGHDRMLRIVRIVLTVAHLDHQPENCAPENLRALCQRCHNRYDAKTRADGVKQRRRAALGVAEMFPGDAA